MIHLNGTTYRLCLLDTNALSEMLKNPRNEFRVFALEFLQKRWIPAFSLFSIFEIRRRRELFESFLDYYSDLPSVVLKGHEQLLEEELAAYPDPSHIDPVLLAPVGIQPPSGWSKRQTLKHVLSSKPVVQKEHYWTSGQTDMLKGILQLVGNFPPHHGRYTESMIQQFVETNVLQQLTMRYPDAVKRLIETPGGLDPRAFPSLRIMALTVFMKFYPDNRQPCESDVFDFIISAPVPYVDGVITERHQAAILRKAKQLHVLSDHLEVHTLASLRE